MMIVIIDGQLVPVLHVVIIDKVQDSYKESQSNYEKQPAVCL